MARPTVAVTSAREGASRLAARLRDAGLSVVECPLVAIEPIDGPPVRAVDYDWVVLTSARAVEQLARRLEGPLPRVATIGPGTAEALRAHGVEPALVARRSTQEGLLAELPRPAGRVLFAGAEGARDLLARELGADVVALYRTVELCPETFPAADLVVLASASAARAFAALGGDLECVSIGPVTSAEARRLGLRIVAEADSYDLGGLVEAVRLAASLRRSSPS
ncbi:MAG: uroporphyrinogen-III synthase [Thermoleophilia bacterium]|nr:uroporphyrinogen-III synthase [Thermoleophilia bacterium]